MGLLLQYRHKLQTMEITTDARNSQAKETRPTTKLTVLDLRYTLALLANIGFGLMYRSQPRPATWSPAPPCVGPAATALIQPTE